MVVTNYALHGEPFCPKIGPMRSCVVGSSSFCAGCLSPHNKVRLDVDSLGQEGLDGMKPQSPKRVQKGRRLFTCAVLL